jgi:broad specificity phosphatase PhoE
VRELLLARHGQSEFSAKLLANGDPGVRCPLTEVGRDQALALGDQLKHFQIDLVAVTEFERVRETAELAVGGRGLPVIVIPELNEPSYGEYEGGPIRRYLDWAWSSGPLEVPPGGEHRGAIAARHATGYRRLLARPEDSIAFFGHALGIRYVLDAAYGRPPTRRVSRVDYAAVYHLSRAELEHAVAVLEAWAAAPAF